MAPDARSHSTRSLRSGKKNTRTKYLNDLPPETVQAIARLASDAKDNEALAPRRQKTPKGSPKRGSPVIKNKATKCDKRLQPLKTTGPKSTPSESPLTRVGTIKAKIATEHAYTKILTEERRSLWDEMESHEALIREHQIKIADGEEEDDLINKRLQVCEMLENKLGDICKRLWTLGGQLDESAAKATEYLTELVQDEK
ncbi:hypothetical protein FPOAC2_11742 [Fusarium poae]|uniref:Uncharacterized protein n=1 Tax=Fusarium poae TaxID=36050 RepID=A0A1B8AEI0_FUSPO|nr:hypothetical protein FPOAC1_011436 [Fusarium poae]KAG8666626.1 hypothetical protein FPOAC1_011436 [Fusarium poae]OBS18881.1 hypothetical protein FPOA_10607 [Fusarium poae]